MQKQSCNIKQGEVGLVSQIADRQCSFVQGINLYSSVRNGIEFARKLITTARNLEKIIQKLK